MRTVIRILSVPFIDDRLISMDSYPFGPKRKRKYEIPQGANIKKAIELEAIRKITAYVPASHKMRFARDMWLFCFYCNGMNMGDVFFLKWENIKTRELVFFRNKTIRMRRNNVPVIVYMTDEAQRILDEWGLPKENENGYVFFRIPKKLDEVGLYKMKANKIRDINRKMKNICASLGIEETVTTNVARHSYATILKNNAVPIAQISENLGHSSIATTAHYLNSFSRGKIKDTAELLEYLMANGCK